MSSTFLLHGKSDRSFLLGTLKGVAVLAAYTAFAAAVAVWLGDTVAISPAWALFLGVTTFFCAGQLVIMYGVHERQLSAIRLKNSYSKPTE